MSFDDNIHLGTRHKCSNILPHNKKTGAKFTNRSAHTPPILEDLKLGSVGSRGSLRDGVAASNDAETPSPSLPPLGLKF